MVTSFNSVRDSVLKLLAKGSDDKFEAKCQKLSTLAKTDQELSTVSVIRGTRLALQRNPAAIQEMQRAVQLDGNNLSAILNLQLLQADLQQAHPAAPVIVPPVKTSSTKVKVAVLSFLFN